MNERPLFDTDPGFVGPPRPLPRVAGGVEDGDGGAGAGGDATAGAGGGEGDPGGEGGDDDGDPGLVDLQAVADEFDAEALGELQARHEAGDDDADTGEGKDGKSGARRKPPSDDPVDEFINKNYQGNRAAFVASLHESRAEARRLADEIAVLKDRVNQGGGPKPVDTAAEFKAIRDADPDVQALDQEISQITEDVKAVKARNVQILGEANGIDQKITQLEARLDTVEDQKEANKIHIQLSRVRSQLVVLNGEYATNESNMRAAVAEQRQLQRELRRAEQGLRDRIEADTRNTKNTNRDMARTRATFFAAFDSLIEPYGLNKEGEKYTYIKETVRTQLADWLEAEAAKNDDFDGLDAGGIYDAVHKLIGRYAKVHGMSPKRKPGAPAPAGARRPLMTPRVPGAGTTLKPGAAAVAAAAGDGGSGRRPAPRTPEDVYSNPDLIRARARRIDEAAARAAGGRRNLG